MYSLYNFFLNRKWSGPVSRRAFLAGLVARKIFHVARELYGKTFLAAAPWQQAPATMELGRILIVRVDRIGDIVLSTPALRALRAALPMAQIDYVVQEKYAGLLNAYSGWNHVYTLREIDSRKERLALAKVLQDRKYNVAIVESTAPSGYRLAWEAKIPIRIGWRAKGYGHLLSFGFRDDRGLANRHQVENNLKLLEPLGIRDPYPSFPVRETDSGKAQLKKFLVEHNLRLDQKLLVIHPGSFSPRVRWSLERFAEIAMRSEIAGMRTVLLGSGAESAIVERVWILSGRKALKAVNCFGLEGLVSFLRFTHVFLGNSTGPMHVAASAGTRTLAVFGSRYPLDRHEMWRPWGANGRVIEAKDVKCCGIPWTCADMPCLASISVEQVWAALKTAWGNEDSLKKAEG